MLILASVAGTLLPLAFLVGLVLVLGFSLYSPSGSGIGSHPFHRRYTDAPGAELPEEVSDFNTFEEQYMDRRGVR